MGEPQTGRVSFGKGFWAWRWTCAWVVPIPFFPVIFFLFVVPLPPAVLFFFWVHPTIVAWQQVYHTPPSLPSPHLLGTFAWFHVISSPVIAAFIIVVFFILITIFIFSIFTPATFLISILIISSFSRSWNCYLLPSMQEHWLIARLTCSASMLDRWNLLALPVLIELGRYCSSSMLVVMEMTDSCFICFSSMLMCSKTMWLGSVVY